MTLNRRSAMKLGGAFAASSFFGNYSLTGWAKSRVELGSAAIDVLSDGNLELPGSLLFDGMPENELASILAEHGVSNELVKPDCNLTLVRDGERTILFDVGSGPNFMPSAGKLTEAMEALELDPSSVTHVVFTHAHPDHLWGLLDEFDDPLFPEAEYRIAKREWDYWTDPKTVDTIGEARQAFAAGATRNLMAIEEKTSLFRFGEEILPGVHAQGTPGHTPGHTSFEVRSGNESVMIVGDAIVNHHVAFEKPAWEANSDQDKAMGATTRIKLLDQLTSEKIKMIGYHLPYPGIGYSEKRGGAYRFVAA